jgi:DNA-binding Lrp family transcriptional regulator
MVTVIVLLNVEKDRIHPVTEILSEMKEITEVYSVAGKFH